MDGYSAVSVNVPHNGRDVTSAVVEMIFDELLSLLKVEESHLFLWLVSHGPLDVPELVGKAICLLSLTRLSANKRLFPSDSGPFCASEDSSWRAAEAESVANFECPSLTQR